MCHHHSSQHKSLYRYSSQTDLVYINCNDIDDTNTMYYNNLQKNIKLLSEELLHQFCLQHIAWQYTTCTLVVVSDYKPYDPYPAPSSELYRQLPFPQHCCMKCSWFKKVSKVYMSRCFICNNIIGYRFTFADNILIDYLYWHYTLCTHTLDLPGEMSPIQSDWLLECQKILLYHAQWSATIYYQSQTLTHVLI